MNSVPDGFAQGTEIGVFGEGCLHLQMQGRLAVLIQVVTVSRRTSGQRGGHRRRSAFAVGTRPYHSVGITHSAAFRPGDMFAKPGQVAKQVRGA